MSLIACGRAESARFLLRLPWAPDDRTQAKFRVPRQSIIYWKSTRQTSIPSKDVKRKVCLRIRKGSSKSLCRYSDCKWKFSKDLKIFKNPSRLLNLFVHWMQKYNKPPDGPFLLQLRSRLIGSLVQYSEFACHRIANGKLGAVRSRRLYRSRGPGFKGALDRVDRDTIKCSRRLLVGRGLRGLHQEEVKNFSRSETYFFNRQVF